MEELEQKSRSAKQKLDCDSYRESLESLENRLHKLRDELYETEKVLLQEEGYKPINIDEYTLMVPIGMSVQQLYVSLQQMKPPNNDDGVVRHFVTEGDLNNIRQSEEYNKVIEKRQDIVSKINKLYEEFWEEEVKKSSNSDEESIIYMLIGLDKDIRSRRLSEVTGISEYTCRKYSLSNGGVVKRNR